MIFPTGDFRSHTFSEVFKPVLQKLILQFEPNFSKLMKIYNSEVQYYPKCEIKLFLPSCDRYRLSCVWMHGDLSDMLFQNTQVSLSENAAFYGKLKRKQLDE